jgi:hypothetical protein
MRHGLWSDRVRNKFLKPLVYLLIAAQLLLAVPAMGALSATDADACPCCPAGADSMNDCLASCTLSAVALQNAQVLAHVSASSMRLEALPSAPPASLAEPPLKPPPIR